MESELQAAPSGSPSSQQARALPICKHGEAGSVEHDLDLRSSVFGQGFDDVIDVNGERTPGGAVGFAELKNDVMFGRGGRLRDGGEVQEKSERGHGEKRLHKGYSRTVGFSGEWALTVLLPG